MDSTGSDSPEEHFETPKTSTRILRKDADREFVQPNNETNVADQTDSFVRAFFGEMLDKERVCKEADNTTPELGVLAPMNTAEFSPAEQVGRQLAMIGDAVNERYASDFGRLIRLLKLEPSTAYETYASVARRDGSVSWGQIIVLLCFGYRVAMTLLRCGMRYLFKEMIQYVVSLVIRDRIAQWIATQGGWRTILYIPESVSWMSIGVIFGFATISLIAVFYLTRK